MESEICKNLKGSDDSHSPRKVSEPCKSPFVALFDYVIHGKIRIQVTVMVEPFILETTLDEITMTRTEMMHCDPRRASYYGCDHGLEICGQSIFKFLLEEVPWNSAALSRSFSKVRIGSDWPWCFVRE